MYSTVYEDLQASSSDVCRPPGGFAALMHMNPDPTDRMSWHAKAMPNWLNTHFGHR